MGFQQFTGQANVLYYAPTIFQSIGFSNDTAALLASIGLGIVKVICTGITILFIDRAGRRKFLLAGSAVMASSLLILTLLTATVSSSDITDPCLREHLLNSSISSAQNFSGAHANLNDINLHSDVFVNSTFLTLHSASGYMALAALMGYISGYSISFGPVTWLVISEIFPSRLKGRAASLTATMNWSANLLVSWTFLSMLSAVGVPVTFLIYSCVCFISMVFVFCCVPETKGRTLEQIEMNLSEEQRSGGESCLSSFLRNLGSAPSQGDYQDLDKDLGGSSAKYPDSLQSHFHGKASEDLPMLPTGPFKEGTR